MEIVEVPLEKLVEASWNPTTMDVRTRGCLRHSIAWFGLVEPLIVRPLEDGSYEVISGNQRLRELREMAREEAPCLVMRLDDAQARLLSQALNHVHGEDDLGLRAELLRKVLAKVPEADALTLLPESEGSLRALLSLGQGDIAAHFEAWQEAQKAKLKHLAVQLTEEQQRVVEGVLARFLPQVVVGEEGNPNKRGLALYHLCLRYRELEGGKE